MGKTQQHLKVRTVDGGCNNDIIITSRALDNIHELEFNCISIADLERFLL